MIIKVLTDWLSHQRPERVAVAYSGGLDSHVLLHALVHCRQQFDFALRAFHVNHGLQAKASHWVAHTKAQCAHYQVPLTLMHPLVEQKPGESLEAIARTARYQAFEDALLAGETLVTAHHQQDQAETLMLQLLRGAGPNGLAGMAGHKPFGCGWHDRPLLTVSSEDIKHYAQKQGITWVEDPSNQDTRFRRNFVRHQVFTLLETYYPGAQRCLARSAAVCGQTQLLLDEYLDGDLAHCRLADPLELNLAPLSAYSREKAQMLIRRWLNTHQVNPSFEVLSQICDQMLNSKVDAQPKIQLMSGYLRRYQQVLYYIPFEQASHPTGQRWSLVKPLSLGATQWRARLAQGSGIRASQLNDNSLDIRFRLGGERCQLANGNGSKSLKKMFQELKVPVWQRATIPLFYYQDTLVGIGDRWIQAGWQVADANEKGWVIECLCE